MTDEELQAIKARCEAAKPGRLVTFGYEHDELKPCPFCGGKTPTVITNVEHPCKCKARTWYAVVCNVCYAVGDLDLGESGAAKKWNTRPTEDALRNEVERLRAEQADAAAQHYLVMSEACPTDEKHCTCVPILRDALAEEHALVQEWVDHGGELATENAALRSENERLATENRNLHLATDALIEDRKELCDRLRAYKHDPAKALRELGHHDVEKFYREDEP